MLVNFQLSSPTPVVELQTKVDDAVVANAQGDDLAAFGSMWFITPEVGTHKLAVWVKNAAGCTKEAVASIPLRVK